MDSETEKRIEETVLDILRSSNMDEVTEFMVRKTASESLGLDLSDPTRKKFVRQVVNSYLDLQNEKVEDEAAPPVAEEEEEDAGGDEDDKKKKRKEFDDHGDLICKLSKNRRVTITEFRGKTLVSMREYYKKGGKDLPTSKGISLTAEQWATFSKSVPAIEKALEKMKSRVQCNPT